MERGVPFVRRRPHRAARDEEPNPAPRSEGDAAARVRKDKIRNNQPQEQERQAEIIALVTFDSLIK